MRRLSIATRLTVVVTVASAVLGVPLILFGERAVGQVLVDRAFAEKAKRVSEWGFVDPAVTESWDFGTCDAGEAPEDERNDREPAVDVTVESGQCPTADDDWVLALIDAVAKLDASDAPLVGEFNEQIGRTRGDEMLVRVEDGRLVLVSATGARSVPVQPQQPAVSQWDLFDIGYLAMAYDPSESEAFEFRRYDTPAGQPMLIGVTTTDMLANARVAGDVIRWLLPPFVLVIAGATWWVARRALRPVAEMTRRVGQISHRGPLAGERLPTPHARDEVAALAVQMNDLLDRIGAGARAQRAFTADAGHELRSPLAVLRSEHEQALARDGSNVLAERSLPELDRLERIVEDLLDLARADEARAPAVASEIDVDDVVFCEADRRRRVPVDVGQVGAAKALADPESVRRVVQHLLDNAARHARATVAVSLRQEHPGAPAVLTVDDDGAGIPPDQRTRVFERFVRLDDARTRGSGGAGLGLSVVAELVAGLGGTVTVEDSPLGGARFRVSLPAAA